MTVGEHALAHFNKVMYDRDCHTCVVNELESELDATRQQLQVMPQTQPHEHSHGCETCKRISEDFQWYRKCGIEADAQIETLEAQLTAQSEELHRWKLQCTREQDEQVELEAKLEAQSEALRLAHEVVYAAASMTQSTALMVKDLAQKALQPQPQPREGR